MKNPLSVFTIVQNEPVFLPLWVEHYLRHVPHFDLYVLDHNSTAEGLTVLQHLQAAYDINVVPVYRTASFDHAWLCHTVRKFAEFLFSSYEAVLFAEVDELILPAPTSPHHTLGEFAAMELTEEGPFVRCRGYEVVQKLDEEEQPLDFDQRPLLSQRGWWYSSLKYSKPLLSKVPLFWTKGFHGASNVQPLDSLIAEDLLLLHLHKIDFDYALTKHRETAARNWSQKDRQEGIGWQNSIADPQKLLAWFRSNVDNGAPAKLSPIPEAVRESVLPPRECLRHKNGS